MRTKIKLRSGKRCWWPFHRFKLVYSDAGSFYFQCRSCKTRLLKQYDKNKIDWKWVLYETENEKPFQEKL